MLGCGKYGAPHYESFGFLITPSRTKHSTSFLNIFSCTFVTRYGKKHIGLSFCFNLKATGSVFNVPSVPSKNSSNFSKNLSKYLCCSYIKYWGLFSIYLFKSNFSYLTYKIIHNHLVEVREFYYLYTFSMYEFLKYSLGVILPIFKILIHTFPNQ